MNHHNGNGTHEPLSKEDATGLIHRILPLTQAMLRLEGTNLTLKRDTDGPGFKVTRPLPDQDIPLVYVRARIELSPFDERIDEPVLHARVFQQAPVVLKPSYETLRSKKLAIFSRSEDMKPRKSTAKRDSHPIAREYFTDLRSILVEPHAVAAERLAEFLATIVGHLRQG